VACIKHVGVDHDAHIFLDHARKLLVGDALVAFEVDFFNFWFVRVQRACQSPLDLPLLLKKHLCFCFLQWVFQRQAQEVAWVLVFATVGRSLQPALPNELEIAPSCLWD
jgi:hypothetical protein